MPVGGKLTSWGHGIVGSPSGITDFTGNMRSVNMTLDGEEIDATVFGFGGFRQYEQGFKNGGFETVYKYETGSTLYLRLANIFLNTAEDEFAFEFGPNGTASGEVKITGNVIMTKIGTPTSVGTLIEVPISWRITGLPDFDDYS